MNNSDLAYEQHLKRREAYRRQVGLWLGGLVGLVFGVVSQTVNLIALPGLNLFQPPFSPVVNIALFILLGALLGGVCGWLTDSLMGVLVASAVGAVLLEVATVPSGYKTLPINMRLIAVLSIFLPVVAGLTPALGVLRWVINEQEEYRYLNLFAWQRVWRVALLVVLTVGVGMLWLMPEQGQQSLVELNKMLQTARSGANLPKPLQPPDVENFSANAQGTYQLEWENHDVNRFMIGYYPAAGWEPAAAMAHFENGWMLVCIYTNPALTPTCKGFNSAP